MASELGASAAEQTLDINDERAHRRARRQALIDAGVNPYPIHSAVDAHVQELAERYEHLENSEQAPEIYTLAGRVRALRNQGKLAFMDLEDATGQIQLFCRIDAMEETSWELISKLDLGDIIQATGQVVRTKRGQLSLAPQKLTMLSKSLRPLPEKYHGMTDRELRYRQRYVDLIMNPEVRDTFKKRSQIVSLIRRYMEDLGYLEVETPMMHAIMGGANAKPFVTHFNALDRDFYLRIATELPLKRCIVGGLERVFELGRQFRNEGMDLTHNPEFTTMEAYCAYSDLEGMKELTQGLFKSIAQNVCGCEPGHEVITYQGQTVDMSGTWKSIALSDVVSEVVGVHVDMNTPLDELRALCRAHQIEPQESWGAGKLLFELYDELGEQTLVNPTFVCDYPQEVSPLSKRKANDPRLTDRFELVICGHEYANAFSELNDPIDQAGRFAAQVAAKGLGDDEAMGYDYDYVRALEYGMPPAGGIGYGIDRMVMLFCDEAAIRDVLLFPQMKPEVITPQDIQDQLAGSGMEDVLTSGALLKDATEGAHLELMRAEEDGAAAGKAGAAAAAGAADTAAGVTTPALDLSRVTIEPLFTDYVDFDTFSKSDFRAVKVKSCEAVPKSKKLLKFVLDDGTGTDRIILSGIHAYYEPQELVGKTLIAITNLPPRAMMGIDSCGMLLSAIHEEEGEERLNLLMVDNNIPAGAKLY